ncbi:MAG: hypothetical protein ACYC2R_02540 [Burkholderiales bacterium]
MLGLVRVIGMIAIASALVAVIFLIWRYVSNLNQEDIDIARFRKLSWNLRQFIEQAQRAGSGDFPHVKAVASWLSESLEWTKGRSTHPIRAAEQFRNDLKKIELPELKSLKEEQARQRGRLHDLETMVEALNSYRALYLEEQSRMLTEKERQEAEPGRKDARQALFATLAALEKHGNQVGKS